MFRKRLFRKRRSVRTRILAVALIPSLALLIAATSAAGILVAQAIHVMHWSGEIQRDAAPGIEFTRAVQQERRLTLLTLGGDQAASSELATQRRHVDDAVRSLAVVADALTNLEPAAMHNDKATFDALGGQIAAVRSHVDSQTLPIPDAYTFYTQLIGTALNGMEILARTAPDPATAVEEATAAGLFRAAEAMDRSNALAGVAVTGNGFTAAQLAEYYSLVGFYRTQLDALAPNLTVSEQNQLRALTTGSAWRQLSLVEDTVIRFSAARPGSAVPLPISAADRQEAAAHVGAQLVELGRTHHDYALRIAADAGRRTARNSLLGGCVAVLISCAAFAISLRLSSTLIRRLKRLRRETLAMADEQLPEIMGKLRDGDAIDLDADVSHLDYGNDEIGHVADAFNRAQLAAVSAAATEARTREGANAVFLNIAYRSQVVVHQQLEILDHAERQQEDPAVLDVLFRLDHLATRERRNAENLIILGGGRPGRQWRNPVPLLELVRSSVAETENYARVQISRLPDLSIAGGAVADLVHLLAELVDNATSFSPPESRVEVSGNVVGRGVVVEIMDQGLGMAEPEIARLNETISNPPDFSVSTLSSDSRLGLFVVARLAARYGVTVRLVESLYGGILAIVVIPSALITVEASPAAPPSIPDTSSAAAEPTQAQRRERPALPRRHRSTTATGAMPVAQPISTHADDSLPAGPARSAEQARDLFSAIESGTRLGRRGPATTDTDVEGGTR